MYDPLGLSIGTTNLVAVRNGNPPVSRRAVLTLFPDRAPELGAPSKDSDDSNVTDTGTLVTGFVERVGRSSALMSGQGSPQDPALLLVEALDALITATGGDASTSNMTIAVPAHWDSQALRRLQDALCTHAGFVRGTMSPRLVSDSITALTALNSDTRLPADGVVALLDFGAAGTSITLADAASAFTPITDTLRYPEFSGDLIDQALLIHVLESVGPTRGVDPASTGVVGQFGNLREECRLAKERLSDETATEIRAELPGQHVAINVTRTELENLIEARLGGVFTAFDDMLRRSRVGRSDLAAVAMSGGVAKIPLVAQRLSDHAKVSVVTAVQPALAMAVGAVMLSARQPFEQREGEPESTTMAAMAGVSTGSFAAATGGLRASTDTFRASTGGFGVPTGAAFVEDPSETLHQLAWSEADESAHEPVFYTGEPYDMDAGATPSQLLQLPKFEPPAEPARGSRLPQLVLGLAALVSMVAIGGVAFTLTSSTSHPPAPAPHPTSAVPSPVIPSSNPPSLSPMPPPSASPAPSATVAPPITSEAPPPPPPVTTTYQPPPSTTHQATSTTPTTTPTTSTTPTTTTTTTPPSSTTTTTSTTPSDAMTTTYLKLPFVPVPIPVQVPQGEAGPSQPASPYQPQAPYQPQYPYGSPGYGY
jgi:hypothetical protein